MNTSRPGHGLPEYDHVTVAWEWRRRWHSVASAGHPLFVWPARAVATPRAPFHRQIIAERGVEGEGGGVDPALSVQMSYFAESAA